MPSSSQNDRKIKAVVFDFGGVIQFWGRGDTIKGVADILNISKETFQKEYFKYNHLSNVNNISFEEMVIGVVKYFDDSKEIQERVKTHLQEARDARTINHELIAFFPELMRQGYQVAIFSNATSRLREELKVLGIDTLVHEIVISGEIGFQKPHKEAFDVLFQRLNVLPEEVVFIDDTPKSLEKADEIGYTPILFKDNAQLRTELQRLGIKM